MSLTEASRAKCSEIPGSGYTLLLSGGIGSEYEHLGLALAFSGRNGETKIMVPRLT